MTRCSFVTTTSSGRISRCAWNATHVCGRCETHCPCPKCVVGDCHAVRSCTRCRRCRVHCEQGCRRNSYHVVEDPHPVVRAITRAIEGQSTHFVSRADRHGRGEQERDLASSALSGTLTDSESQGWGTVGVCDASRGPRRRVGDVSPPDPDYPWSRRRSHSSDDVIGTIGDEDPKPEYSAKDSIRVFNASRRHIALQWAQSTKLCQEEGLCPIPWDVCDFGYVQNLHVRRLYTTIGAIQRLAIGFSLNIEVLRFG